VKSYAQANHNPVAVCNGDRTRKVLEIAADPGDTVKLGAAGSSDPDGNKLSYRWSVYREAGSYWDEAPIRGADATEAVVTVPEKASGRTIHVILEIVDDGDPPLTAYRRVILEVSGEPVAAPPEAGSDEVYLRTPITGLAGPPAATGKWEFYRGINLNGPPIEIDGNRWEGDDAPSFECTDRALNSPQVRLRPPTDDARAKMIHSFRWNGQASLALTSVPAGKYAVYAYVWEETRPETLTIRLNGRVVARNYYSGVQGEWHRVGPWIATVTDGKLEIASTGGAANFSGIEVWRSVGDGSPR